MTRTQRSTAGGGPGGETGAPRVCQVQEGSSSSRGRSPSLAHSIHRCSASHGQLAGLPAHLQEVDTCSREDVTKYLGLLCLLTVFVLFQKASHHLSHTQKPPGFHKLSFPVVFGDGQDGSHFSALSLTVQSQYGNWKMALCTFGESNRTPCNSHLSCKVELGQVA